MSVYMISAFSLFKPVSIGVLPPSSTILCCVLGRRENSSLAHTSSELHSRNFIWETYIWTWFNWSDPRLKANAEKERRLGDFGICECFVCCREIEVTCGQKADCKVKGVNKFFASLSTWLVLVTCLTYRIQCGWHTGTSEARLRETLELLSRSIATCSLRALNHQVKYLSIFKPPSCEMQNLSAEALLDETPCGEKRRRALRCQKCA